MGILYEPAGRAREYAALAANLYAGCGHGCVYCYAPDALRKERDSFHSNPQPRAKAIEILEKDCAKGDKKGSVLFSFSCDPYQPIDEQYQLTRHKNMG